MIKETKIPYPRLGSKWEKDNRVFIVDQHNLTGVKLVEEEIVDTEAWELGEPDSFYGRPFQVSLSDLYENYTPL